jgi:hypothetical protein
VRRTLLILSLTVVAGSAAAIILSAMLTSPYLGPSSSLQTQDSVMWQQFGYFFGISYCLSLCLLATALLVPRPWRSTDASGSRVSGILERGPLRAASPRIWPALLILAIVAGLESLPMLFAKRWFSGNSVLSQNVRMMIMTGLALLRLSVILYLSVQGLIFLKKRSATVPSPKRTPRREMSEFHPDFIRRRKYAYRRFGWVAALAVLASSNAYFALYDVSLLAGPQTISFAEHLYRLWPFLMFCALASTSYLSVKLLLWLRKISNPWSQRAG